MTDSERVFISTFSFPIIFFVGLYWLRGSSLGESLLLLPLLTLLFYISWGMVIVVRRVMKGQRVGVGISSAIGLNSVLPVWLVL